MENIMTTLWQFLKALLDYGERIWPVLRKVFRISAVADY